MIMADQPEEPKRRGRPRLSDDERKRHTMTFRMRSDLRAAVDELAQQNGRSISEQIEYYVEKGVRHEAAIAYQYSAGKMSPALFKCITGLEWGSGTLPANIGPGIDLNKPPAVTALVGMDAVGRRAAAAMIPLMQDMLEGYIGEQAPPWMLEGFQVMEKGLAEKGRLLDAERELALRRTERERALEAELGRLRGLVGEVVANARSQAGAPQGEPALSMEEILGRIQGAIGRLSDAFPASPRATRPAPSIAQIESEFENLLGRRPSAAPSDGTVHSPRAGYPLSASEIMDRTRPRPAPRDHSVAALVALIEPLEGTIVDIEALWLSNWPHQFPDLPSDTRAHLVEVLKDEAAPTYEGMIFPMRRVDPSGATREKLHARTLMALKRMRRALLPGGSSAEDADAGQAETKGRRAARGA